MNPGLWLRLSVMMFFQFFVWGAWYSTIAVYMSKNGMESLTHWPFTVNPIAAIIAPFFVGLIADRYFSSQKVLGILHILGALFMFMTPSATGNPLLFILLLLAYNLCYMPTMSLANTVCFHQMTNQEKQFPFIRVFGTIGWIVAGLLISYVMVNFVTEGMTAEESTIPMYMTAIGSLLLGIYSFSLPNTPPPAKGKKVTAGSIIGVDAFRQLGSPSFYIFLVSSLLICIPLAAYYNFTQVFLQNANFGAIAATQTLGQASETFFMLLMPLMFVRLGFKWMLVAGMAAWVLRYSLFAMAAPDTVTWMILAGIALHGICYDFFFVTGQIYVDKKATAQIRGQAQGLIIFVTYGVGMLVGAQVAGLVFNNYLGNAKALTPDQWQSFWWLPAMFAAGVLLFFIAFFKDRKTVTAPAVAVNPATQP